MRAARSRPSPSARPIASSIWRPAPATSDSRVGDLAILSARVGEPFVDRRVAPAKPRNELGKLSHPIFVCERNPKPGVELLRRELARLDLRCLRMNAYALHFFLKTSRN